MCRLEQRPRKKRDVERSCWAYRSSDHVAVKCPRPPDSVRKQQDDINHETSRKAGTYGVFFFRSRVDRSGAETVEDRTVITEAETEEQALKVRESSFSVGDEAITCWMPKSIRHPFRALLHRT